MNVDVRVEHGLILSRPYRGPDGSIPFSDLQPFATAHGKAPIGCVRSSFAAIGPCFLSGTGAALRSVDLLRLSLVRALRLGCLALVLSPLVFQAEFG